MARADGARPLSAWPCDLVNREFNYETKPESATPWEQVPEDNRRLMIATRAEVLRKLNS